LSDDLNLSPVELSEFISEIYQAAMTSNWGHVLNQLIDITQSNKAFFFLQKLDVEHPLIMEIKCNFEYPPNTLLEYQSRPFDDPLYQGMRWGIEGDPYNLNQLIDIESHIGSDFYDNIYLPMKTHYSLAGVLCRDEKYESVFAVN